MCLLFSRIKKNKLNQTNVIKQKFFSRDNFQQNTVFTHNYDFQDQIVTKLMTRLYLITTRCSVSFIFNSFNRDECLGKVIYLVVCNQIICHRRAAFLSVDPVDVNLSAAILLKRTQRDVEFSFIFISQGFSFGKHDFNNFSNLSWLIFKKVALHK